MNFLFNLLNAGASDSSQNQTAPLNWPFLLICVGAIVILMVISSRQRKKQQEAANEKLNNIKIGDQVKTIGLVYGEIVEIDRDMETFVIKTGSDACPSYIKVDKMAIYQVIPPLQPQAEPELFGDDTQTNEEVNSESDDNVDAE